MLKGVLFDFNGVLLLDTKWHEEAWDDLSIHLRKIPVSPEESEMYIHGRTPHDTLVYLLGREPTPEESIELLDRKEKLYQEVCLKHKEDFKLSPGAIELFQLLEKNRIKKTIATSSPLINLNFYFDNLNLETWFTFEKVVYADGTFPGKPAPDIFLKAAAKILVPIKDCAVIEDASSGVAAAKNAGVAKVIFLSTADNKSTALKVQADKIVTTLAELEIHDFD